MGDVTGSKANEKKNKNKNKLSCWEMNNPTNKQNT
jgi:hypothetical protein